jgi:multidrug resistance efflux pump
MATLKGIQASLDLLEGLSQRQAGLVSPTQLTDLRQQRDVLDTRIRDNREVLVEIDRQFRDAEQRLKAFPDLEMSETEPLLAPIQEGIKVQEARMETINIQIENLVIRSPVDGTITAIYRWPGQRIAAGDLICSLFREDAQYVVSYVRPEQRIRPYKGMEVSLRLRAPGSLEYRSSVESVGPPAAPVPPRHLRDQGVLEWATPVKIPIPPELQSQHLEPGQLLQVIFDDNS